MKIVSEQHLKTATEEELMIYITFNPQNPEEEGLAAMLATIADLVKNYNRINTLVGDDNANP